MATYHFNAQVVSRSCGASAVAGAAYRSGECLTDTRTGEEHDHTARDDLDGAEILVPPNAPEWAQDRAALRDELRTIQQQIEQLQDFIRRGVEKVKEKVKGLVHGPQPDRADTSAEPTKPAQEPQRGGDRDGDTWIPGEGFLGRR